MKVEEAFKGISVGANVTVRARENKTSCGLGTISVDDRWQIWLNENGTTNSCTRTTSDFNKNWEELELLAHKPF